MEENNNNTNTNNTNNNNNNEKQVLNTEVGCSAKQRKRRDLIDLNESPPSSGYSQVFIYSLYSNTCKDDDQDHVFTKYILRQSYND